MFEMGIEVLGGKRRALEGTGLLHDGGEAEEEKRRVADNTAGRVGGSWEHPPPPHAPPNITFPRAPDLATAACPLRNS